MRNLFKLDESEVPPELSWSKRFKKLFKLNRGL